ncbi:hypothetical protein [Streptomyces sp. G7(2002)]|nr:hypothetical protein [Streptomyces sp. G7(2002)]WDT52552.1 hypothetical protein NUT86_00005 [Streptomyces sp. G7(2002)]
MSTGTEQDNGGSRVRGAWREFVAQVIGTAIGYVIAKATGVA